MLKYLQLLWPLIEKLNGVVEPIPNSASPRIYRHANKMHSSGVGGIGGHLKAINSWISRKNCKFVQWSFFLLFQIKKLPKSIKCEFPHGRRFWYGCLRLMILLHGFGNHMYIQNKLYLWDFSSTFNLSKF